MASLFYICILQCTFVHCLHKHIFFTVLYTQQYCTYTDTHILLPLLTLTHIIYTLYTYHIPIYIYTYSVTKEGDKVKKVEAAYLVPIQGILDLLE